MAYSEMTTRAAGYTVLYTDWNAIVDNLNAMSAGFVPGGRLTGTTADPTADSSSTANLYYTPHLHNSVKLYDGANWVFYNFSEITLALTGLANGYNYDVFLYNNSGTLTLETTQWSSATARATALVRQDGVWVRSGATTRLYLGTIRTSALGQTIDSNAFRFIWNMYNRVAKEAYIYDDTNSWSYSTDSWRSWNNNSANSIGMVRGLDEDVLDVTFLAHAEDNYPAVGLNIDSAGGDGMKAHTTNTQLTPLTVRYCDKPGLGYHALFLSERAIGAAATTFYGDGGSSSILSAARGYAIC